MLAATGMLEFRYTALERCCSIPNPGRAYLRFCCLAHATGIPNAAVSPKFHWPITYILTDAGDRLGDNAPAFTISWYVGDCAPDGICVAPQAVWYTVASGLRKIPCGTHV